VKADAPENDVAELLSPESAPVSSLVTPNVQREVRDFFGCDTLAGAELEDDGGVGTVNKHFETRLFQVLFLHHQGCD
jgi:leishmanolysin-like peptidase